MHDASALFCLPNWRVCVPERQKGEILFVFFLFCLYLPAFYGRHSSFFFAGAREGKREGEKESILNFLLKRKFICSC